VGHLAYSIEVSEKGGCWTMPMYEDHYRILQVHHLAETEVIESAYKRLAKKYHPDVNKSKDSVKMMQKINQAYEVLSDQIKRRQYDLVWNDKYNKFLKNDHADNNPYIKNEKSFSSAKAVLDKYFRNIINKRFDCSYELISSIDKQNITKDDYIRWQKAVSEVFRLTEYRCKVCGVFKDKLINGNIFEDIVEFSISVVEYNAVMDMMEKDYFTKMTVLEEGKWRILVGYEEIQPLINKFKSLTGLLTAKSVINELVQAHSKIDNLTGLLNQRGIIERIENEILRYNRYGNAFSLIICDIDIAQNSDVRTYQEIKDHFVKLIGEILLSNLRKLDVVGRWGEKAFLILVPETELASAVKVTQKLNRILKSKIVEHDKQTYKITYKFGTVEYESSLEESLDRIYS